MKKVIFLLTAIVIGICSITTLSSCSGDEDFDSITGTWYGTRVYYNPVGGNKYQYLSITFEDNGTGSLEYEAPTSYAVAKFTYSIKNGIITCNGAYANTDGDIEGDFKMTLRIEGDRLIPVDKYNVFILTRDNSVMTDGDGNELTDSSDLMYGVWLHDSGEVVLVLEESSFTEYTLLSSSSNIYSSKTEGHFRYNQVNKSVHIDGVKFEVTLLTETSLQLKSEKNNYFNYKRGSQSDIPTNGENSNDYKAILENASFGWSDKNNDVIMNFNEPNNVHYIERSLKDQYTYLRADGTYTISGNKIICDFDDVTWGGGYDFQSNYFPGWTYNKPCTKTFTIVSLNVDSMILEREGKKYYLYNMLSYNK